MKTGLRYLSIALLAVGLPLSANATMITYAASLSAANEPSLVVPSTGTGFAVVTLDDVANTLKVDFNYTGLTSNATLAHIHCCVAAGQSTGVAVGFTGFPQSPPG